VSYSTWAEQEELCYVHGTSFQTEHGEIFAENLWPGDRILGRATPTGGSIPVQVIDVVALHDCQCVWLASESAEMMITTCHRIPVLRGDIVQTVPAGHLRLSDTVFLASGKQEVLVTVQSVMPSDVTVFKVTFYPDVLVPTFYIGEGFLTMGWKQFIRTRRGGRRTRSQRQPQQHQQPHQQ